MEIPNDKGTMTPINDHVWLLRDEHNDTCYLVAGRERAALIDTMSGFVNVREMAESVTKLPLICLNTHGHGDHILGDLFVGEAYLHPADLPMAEETFRDPSLLQLLSGYGIPVPRFIPIRGGDVIDLGGLTLETLELPGHTPGSVCFLLREDRILFTGDSINRHLWMQLDGCCTLRQYAENLKPFRALRGRAELILHGHASGPEDFGLTEKLIRGLNDVVSGNTGADSDYTWFGGTCRQHPFDENSVIVYGENIL